MLETDPGTITVNTTAEGVTTISFFHPAQNSLPSAILDK
jgi:methylglutaconyl-CoA hydratase